MTFIYETNKEQPERVVCLHVPSTQQTIIIEDIKIEQIEPVTLITDTSESGIVTVTSNSIEQITKVETTVTQVVETITQQFTDIKVENIESVSTTSFTGAQDYVFIVETESGATEQIEATYVKETGVTTVTNVQVMGEAEVIVQPVPLPVVVIEPEAPQTIEIVQVIQETTEVTQTLGQNIKVVDVIEQTSNIGSTFELTVTNEQQSEFIVVAEKEITTGEIRIVETRPIKNLSLIHI